MNTPSQADIDQLLALFAARRYADLEQAASSLLARSPEAGFVWKALSVAQKFQGKASLPAAQEAARLLPDDAEALLNLGAAQRERGLLDAAIASYRRTLLKNPGLADAHSNLANALADQSQLDEAVSHCRQAIAFAPQHAGAWLNLGYLLQRMGLAQESIDASRRAIALTPANAYAHNNLANALRDLGQLAEAESHYREALKLHPANARALLSLAALLTDLGRPAEAAACCHAALKIEPQLAEAHNNLADACKELQQFDAALAAYTQALALKPDHAQTHYNMSLLLLTLGRYDEAWPHHEWRTDPQRGKSAVRPPPLTSTAWQGEALDGQHIVLCHEQGYGDTIQFIRYATLLKQMGAARVSLVCPSPLVPLMVGAAGVDDVFVTYETVPQHDYHVLTMSLPHRCATRLDTIPAPIPYLAAQARHLEKWRTWLPQSGFKLGLAWKGSAHHKNDHNRSLPHLSSLAPLWQVPGISFVSLQKDQGEDEAAAPPPGQPLAAFAGRIDDFGDMAALVQQMDLVIAVDTAVAHLAGALDKPCWVLLPAGGTDWRWLRERDDSPWYPTTMRLYRQQQAGDWRGAIERMAADLHALTHERQ